MADKTIGELPAASEVNDDSLLVMEQQGQARSVKGDLIKKYAREATAAYVEDARKSAEAAAEAAKDAADVALHPPILKEGSDHWWTWSAGADGYVESELDAGVSLTVSPETVTGEPGSEAKVENIGTATDPVLKFTLPKGEAGADGSDGVSPKVEVTKAGKDTTITITDAEGEHIATVRDGEAAIPDHLIVGSDSELGAVLPVDADTLAGHPAGYFAGKEATEKALQRKTGENILHNARWDKQVYIVNQRGVSGTIEVQGYFIDRWKLTSGTVQITDSGLVLDGTMVQILENDPGEGLVASVLTSTGLGTATYANKTFTITATGQTLLAAKLEVGDEQTLARQSGAGWMLNDPAPDYGAELAKCQRYYYRAYSVPGNVNLSGRCFDTKNAYVTFYLPCSMRVSPTVNILGTHTSLSTPGKSVGTPEVYKAALASNQLLLRCADPASGLTARESAVLVCDGIEVSADL